jgi:hypothetical protein
VDNVLQVLNVRSEAVRDCQSACLIASAGIRGLRVIALDFEDDSHVLSQVKNRDLGYPAVC